MRKRDFAKVILIIVFATALIACILQMNAVLSAIDSNTDFDVESLRWSIIGAIGGWVGSAFGAFALVVSLFAIWLPQKEFIKATFSHGAIVSCDPSVKRMLLYTISVRNVGTRSVVVNNIYMHFGAKKNKDLFLGKINLLNSELRAYEDTLPKRLEPGESFDYYLDGPILDEALQQEKDIPLNAALFIRVDTATGETRYFKTEWKYKSFVT